MLPLLTVLVLALMGTYLGENHQVLCLEVVQLTMAPDSYDDQYIGCSSEMEDQLMDPTKNEFDPENKYTSIWENAVSHWNKNKGSGKLPDNFKREYGIALLAYTDHSNLFGDFNAAIRTGGKSTMSYKKDFRFKSFHFLVTKAIQVLRAPKASCYYVYRGVGNKSFTVHDHNKPVRFGQFASSSLRKDIAEDFGTGTFFTIKTCLGAKITKYSYFSEKEVLIPPYETFKVVKVTMVNNETQITLHHVSKSSNFNCGFKRDESNSDVLSVDDRGSSSDDIDDGYSDAAPSSLNPGVPASFLLWGFLLFSGSL